MVRGYSLRILLLALAVWLALNLTPGNAEEPARRFVDALRERGYHGMALEYLERLSSSPLLPDELRATIDYEQGVTLVDGISGQRDYRVRSKQLELAHQKFDKFLAAHPDHDLASTARIQQGRIQFDRGNNCIRRSELQTTAAGDRKKLRDQAARYFGDAMGLFEKNRASIKVMLQGLPPASDPKKDADVFKRRVQLRSDYVLVRFQAALVAYESAKSLSQGEADSTKRFQAALKRFEGIAKDYRNRLRGIESIYYQGLCHKALGNTKEALGFFSEMLALSADDPDLRRIKTNSLTEAIQLWGLPEEDKIDPAIKAGEQWLAEQRPNERRLADWSRLKLAVANAYVALAKSGGGDAKSMTRARHLANEVSRVRGAHQREAQELLVDWGKPQKAAPERPQPKTFDEAVDAAREIHREHQMANATVNQLTPRLARVTAPAEKKEIAAAILEAEQQLPGLRTLEIELLRQAIEIADGTVTAEQINELRSQQCYYYYLLKEDLKAIVLGEFLGRRFPAETSSRQSMRIALASLTRFGNSLESENEEIARRIVEVATQITKTWPDTKEAEAASAALTDAAIKASDFDAAEKYLDAISSDSPLLGDYEMATGQAIWREYITRRQSEGDSSAEEINALRERALKLLNRGIDRKRSVALTNSTVRAILNLAQSYVDSQAFDQAVALLDDEKTGPHALTLAKQTIMDVPGLREQSIRTAIQAYIGSIKDAESAAENMNKALASLDVLQSLGDGGNSRGAALMNEYVHLAQKLDQQLKLAPPNARVAIAQGYEKILNRIAASEPNTSTLLWATQSLAALGSSLSLQTGPIKLEGRRILAEAVKLFETLLQSSELDERQKTAIRFRIAIIRRELGEFQLSIDQLAKLISRDERQLAMQIEAARTFQMWGESEDRLEAFARAIQGDREITAKRRNLIWGWGLLSQKLGRNPAHRKTFFDARYNLADCRLSYAMRLPESKRPKQLKMAKNDIVFTARLYPQLGGDSQKQDYDKLLKRVQTQLGEPPTGLASLTNSKRSKSNK